jgi:hypothetical protein
MASLFKPLTRCIATLRQAQNNSAIITIVQQRLKSDVSTTGRLDKPLEKKAVDPLADPKETCNIQFFYIVKLLDLILTRLAYYNILYLKENN